MTYTPPNTFTPGDPLVAKDLSDNLDALATYYTKSIALADVEPDSVETYHIVRPRFTPVNENVVSTYFQTGSIHTVTLPCIDWVGDTTSSLYNVPFVPSGFICEPYQSDDNGAASYKPVPRTFSSFYVYKTSAVLVRVSVGLLFPEDNVVPTMTKNHLYIQLDGDGTGGHESRCRVPEMESAIDVYSGRPLQTCVMFTDVAVGWHHVGLVCGLASALGLVAGSQIVVEVIHTGA